MEFPIYRGGGQKAQLPPLTEGAVRIANDWQTRGLAYQPDEGLQHAVSVAYLLGKPLLVSGEPGVGKTDLAYSIAHAFDRGEPIKLECKSSSVARDLFYTYDTLGRYLGSQWGAPGKPNLGETGKPATHEPLAYIHYQGLGEAIVRAAPEEMAAYLPEGWMAGKKTGPTVVLIDEVDKAPRDFPNDILNEIEKMYFRVPELGNVILPPRQLPAELRPFVVITSNSEKNLPEAFLRRCVFYHIPFPEKRLETIAGNHFPQIAAGSPFLTSALHWFLSLREEETAWEKAPSTAEFLDWIEAMLRMGGNNLLEAPAGPLSAGEPLRGQAHLVRQSMGALAKGAADSERLHRIFGQWLKGEWPPK